ncbi:serine/threonine-protein phosphatase [Nocardioides sp. ChNu-153]|nr:protein phosphatase 2C domain-containing protein [Nocardioides sp. ChNu-99]MDN7121517.1 serine/threonine-protein phosphatase [Nocardioides sp. ChNu-153]
MVPGDPVGLHLDFAAVSDVGRVRKDNQDSGYAGARLLAVCDGVGGAARGDVASSTAVAQLRRLDETAASEDLLGQVAGGLLRAHTRIGELVDDDPDLNGTSTTATVALFDGARIGVAHVGDSRAYLYRSGEITQLTKDHTFVQSLIDEGRITEDEARTHPHRNLILKALDGVHETDPDLFTVDVAQGDRLLLCSDGACGVLDDARLADILGTGTPDFAAVELVRASLEAGSTDNVTCIVADVTTQAVDAEPQLVGAAAELPRRALAGSGAGITGLFRGHRSGDTGEIDPVPADLPESVGFVIPSDPVDPEAARYAPLPPRRFVWVKRLFLTLVALGLLAAAAGAAYAWSQRQFYVGEHEGKVAIHRGLTTDLLGIPLSEPYETSDVDVADLSDSVATRLEEGIAADDLADAEERVAAFAADAADEAGSTTDPTDPADPTPTTPTAPATPSAPGDDASKPPTTQTGDTGTTDTAAGAGSAALLGAGAGR